MLPEELARIEAAKHDSIAFETLFQQYMPLIINTIRPYHLRDYARDDWLQEARIAMHKATLRYDGSAGSKFGPFYKLVLVSHLRSLVRHSFAKKRQADLHPVMLYDSLIENGHHRLTARQVENGMLLRLELVDFVGRLSPLERQAFLSALTREPLPRHHRLARAQERSHRKFIHFIGELERPAAASDD